MEFSAGKVSEIAGFLTKLRVKRVEVTKSLEGDRDRTNHIRMVFEDALNGGVSYGVSLNFSHDYTEVWTD